MGIRRNGVKSRVRINTEAGTGIMVSLIVLALGLFAQTAFAASMSVVPLYQEVFAGEVFTVNISIDPAGSEVFGAQYELHFNNSVLNATFQEKGPFFGIDATVLKNEINNTLGWIKYGETRTKTPGVSNPGVLATITFKAIAEEDGTSPLTFTVVKLSDPEANPIPVTVSNGSVSVRTGICGDVNNDRSVNMADVMTLWYDIADYPAPGAYTISFLSTADVNRDGTINMGDVMTLWYALASYPHPGAYKLDCG
ncbi:MAG: hypothetical protein EFT35_01720 [Methanophagales archaeon ANME-1-THS]|nr:MAG: hypothetical protein EFT35_01720 [Methanophagales archaeon ANME-1-THS]